MPLLAAGGRRAAGCCALHMSQRRRHAQAAMRPAPPPAFRSNVPRLQRGEDQSPPQVTGVTRSTCWCRWPEWSRGRPHLQSTGCNFQCRAVGARATALTGRRVASLGRMTNAGPCLLFGWVWFFLQSTAVCTSGAIIWGRALLATGHGAPRSVRHHVTVPAMPERHTPSRPRCMPCMHMPTPQSRCEPNTEPRLKDLSRASKVGGGREGGGWRGLHTAQ